MHTKTNKEKETQEKMKKEKKMGNKRRGGSTGWRQERRVRRMYREYGGMTLALLGLLGEVAGG